MIRMNNYKTFSWIQSEIDYTLHEIDFIRDLRLALIVRKPIEANIYLYWI